jgi:hypothetical protein
MKFFTQAWISGEMTEAQAATVPETYRCYLAALHLPPAIAALSQVNPHDAYLLGLEDQPQRSRLSLRLRCGDLQRGYSDVFLAFSDVKVDATSLDTLRRAVRPSRMEVLYDEVDRAGDCYDYRLVFFPDGEVSILFRQVEITEQPVADREAE